MLLNSDTLVRAGLASRRLAVRRRYSAPAISAPSTPLSNDATIW